MTEEEPVSKEPRTLEKVSSYLWSPRRGRTRQRSRPKMCSFDSEPCLCGFSAPVWSRREGSLCFGPQTEGTRQRSRPKLCEPDSARCLRGLCGGVDKESLYFGPHAEGTHVRGLDPKCAPDSAPCSCGFSGALWGRRQGVTLFWSPRRGHASEVSTQNVCA
jgi:hypothetical protein